MPVTVRWGDPDLTILHYTVSGVWTWEEFYTTLSQGRQMREARGPESVRIIVEFLDTQHVPKGVMSHFGNMFRRGAASNDKVERIIIVKPGKFLTAIADMLQKLNPKILSKVIFVETAAEAYSLLGYSDIP